MTDRELLQMALDALEDVADDAEESHKTVSAIKALRAALANEFNPDWDRVEALQESLREHMAEIQRLRARLAQPEPEYWMKECADFWNRYTYLNEMAQEKRNEQAKMWIEKLRDAPPQREWQGLTDEEIIAMRHMRDWTAGWTDIRYAREIEAKLKEKNINLDTHFGVEK